MLWVLWLSTAALAVSQTGTLFSTCDFVNDIINRACRETQAIEAFSFLAWIARAYSRPSYTLLPAYTDARTISDGVHHHPPGRRDHQLDPRRADVVLERERERRARALRGRPRAPAAPARRADAAVPAAVPPAAASADGAVHRLGEPPVWCTPAYGLARERCAWAWADHALPAGVGGLDSLETYRDAFRDVFCGVVVVARSGTWRRDDSAATWAFA